jgi:hypothetical protein
MRDEGAGPVGLVALRGRPAGGGRKPPRGAPVKSRGAERRGKGGKRRTTGMKKEMQILYIEVLATHDGPEPCVGCSQGWRRSVGRGRAGRLLSRESPSSGCRRLRLERKATPPATLSSSRRGTPRGQRTQACTKFFMRRTGRSCGRPWTLMMPRPGWFAGWQIGVLAGREGNAEAVIPR